MAAHLLSPALCGNARCHLIPPIKHWGYTSGIGYLLLAIADHEGPGVEGVQTLVNVPWHNIVVLEIPFSLVMLLLLAT